MKNLLYLLFAPFILFENELIELNNQVKQDLEYASFPDDWITPKKDTLDVAIIGGGMAGYSAAFALKRFGINQIGIFDENPSGEEGPWVTYGKMKILQTDKSAVGPAFHFPTLTFQAWYEKKFGKEEWKKLDKPTPSDWMRYLMWFASILELPIKNNCQLKSITPINNNLFLLEFNNFEVLAKKIVLATGREGFGHAKIFEGVKKLPKSLWKHSTERIDYKSLKGKNIVIIGCGSAAFDAAGEALEEGAESVSLLYRRKILPQINKLMYLSHAGCEQGYYHLSDSIKWKLTLLTNDEGVSPAEEAQKRVKNYKNFSSFSGTSIYWVQLNGKKILLKTSQGSLNCDFLILATGYQFASPLLLENFHPQIALWKDRIITTHEFGDAPYLGASYEFLEKNPGTTPYLKHIHCFNYGALVSHGLTTSSIDSIGAGASRLAEGIASDFFLSNIDEFIQIIESPN